MAISGTRNKIQLIGHLGKDVEVKTVEEVFVIGGKEFKVG